MLQEANAAAAENSKNAATLIAEENSRVDDARRAAAASIEQLQSQLQEAIARLEQIKTENRPSRKPRPEMYDMDAEDAKTNAVADEISQNLEALIGTTEDTEPKAAPQPAVADTTTKFADLKFGRNYDPNH